MSAAVVVVVLLVLLLLVVVDGCWAEEVWVEEDPYQHHQHLHQHQHLQRDRGATAAVSRRAGKSRRRLSAAAAPVQDGVGTRDPYNFSQTSCTSLRHTDLLIYNRVPKAGSTTMLMHLEQAIKDVNGSSRFTFLPIRMTDNFKSDGKRAPARDPIWRERMQEYVMKEYLQHPAQLPMFVHGHFLHLSFDQIQQAAKQHSVRIAHMNMLRHPVAKVISQYQYLQSEARGSKRDKSNLAFDKNVTLDECVQAIARSPEGKPTRAEQSANIPCDGSFIIGSSQWRYFCGYAPECFKMDPSEGLEIAKKNLLETYAFVGLLDEIDLSYRALKTLFPTFFEVHRQTALPSDSSHLKENVNREKYVVSATSRRLLMTWLEETGEMDFYHFAAALFWDKITCIMNKYWRSQHIREDMGVLHKQ